MMAENNSVTGSVTEEYVPEQIAELEAQGIEMTKCIRCKKLGYDLRNLERYDIDEDGFFAIRYRHPNGHIIQRDKQTNQIIKTIPFAEQTHEVGRAIGIRMGMNQQPQPQPQIIPTSIPIQIPPSPIERSRSHHKKPTILEMAKQAAQMATQAVQIATQAAQKATDLMVRLQLEEIQKPQDEQFKPQKIKPKKQEVKQLPKKSTTKKDHRIRLGNPKRDPVKCPKHPDEDAYEYYNDSHGISYKHLSSKTKDHNHNCIMPKGWVALSPKTMAIYRGDYLPPKPSPERVKELMQEYEKLRYVDKSKYPQQANCKRCGKLSVWTIAVHASPGEWMQRITEYGILPIIYVDFRHVDDKKQHIVRIEKTLEETLGIKTPN